jgi:hypothetical protein
METSVALIGRILLDVLPGNPTADDMDEAYRRTPRYWRDTLEVVWTAPDRFTLACRWRTNPDSPAPHWATRR